MWGQAAAWLSTEDWLILKLTGAPATDYSVASRTMLFDRHRREWSAELLAAAGLEASLMPPAGQSGTPAGRVSREAAEATGLAPGTPVVLGGHDHICAAFVAGSGEGLPVDSTGSAEALVASAAVPPEGDGWLAAHVNCYPDVIPGRMALVASVGLAGGLVDWLRREVWRWADDESGAYERMFAEIRRPVRPNGLVCFPQFGRGASPRWEPERAHGAFIGFTAGHHRGDLLQAVLESSCFSLRHNLDWMEQNLGVAVPRLRVLGGAVHIPLWMQLKADITGREVEVAAAGEPAALGAAVLGGVGAGVYPDHGAGAAAVAAAAVGGGQRVRPDRERAEAYRVSTSRCGCACPTSSGRWPSSWGFPRADRLRGCANRPPPVAGCRPTVGRHPALRRTLFADSLRAQPSRCRPAARLVAARRSCRAGVAAPGGSRQVQLPPKEPGAFIRPSGPISSTSCSGATARKAGEAQATRIRSQAMPRPAPPTATRTRRR